MPDGTEYTHGKTSALTVGIPSVEADWVPLSTWTNQTLWDSSYYLSASNAPGGDPWLSGYFFGAPGVLPWFPDVALGSLYFDGSLHIANGGEYPLFGSSDYFQTAWYPDGAVAAYATNIPADTIVPPPELDSPDSVDFSDPGPPPSYIPDPSGVNYFDGIPQSWWNQYGLGTNSSAAADPDLDGWSNLQEYIAGTDPTSPSSNPNLTAQASRSGGLQFIVGPPTTNSRLYDVWIATNLTGGVWQELDIAVPGASNGSAITLTVTNGAGANQFFRTGIKLP